MSEERINPDDDVRPWIRVIFCGSFFLPVLYEVLVLVPFDQGIKSARDFRLILQSGWVAVLLISLLAPGWIIVSSRQKWAAKVGQILFALFAWCVVQILAVLGIAVWSLTQHGFDGIF